MTDPDEIATTIRPTRPQLRCCDRRDPHPGHDIAQPLKVIHQNRRRRLPPHPRRSPPERQRRIQRRQSDGRGQPHLRRQIHTATDTVSDHRLRAHRSPQHRHRPEHRPIRARLHQPGQNLLRRNQIRIGRLQRRCASSAYSTRRPGQHRPRSCGCSTRRRRHRRRTRWGRGCRRPSRSRRAIRRQRSTTRHRWWQHPATTHGPCSGRSTTVGDRRAPCRGGGGRSRCARRRCTRSSGRAWVSDHRDGLLTDIRLQRLLKSCRRNRARRAHPRRQTRLKLRRRLRDRVGKRRRRWRRHGRRGCRK